ncbi:MAG: ABC transporter permease [Simkaniaceae bacterium]
MFLAKSLIFPTFSEVLYRFYDQGPRLWHHVHITLLEMSLGMISAIFMAFPVALLMARYQSIRTFFQPILIAMKAIPMFVLTPFILLFFGFSLLSIVIPTALMIFFPLSLSIYRGLMATPKKHLNFFRIHGYRPWQIFFKCRLPFAFPHIFSGLRIGAATATMSALAGEWAGGQEGLGIFIQEMRYHFDLEGIYAALLSLILLSLGFYGLFLLLEKVIIGKKRYEL